LKGRYHWNKRTNEGFKQATNFFQEAIVKDPNYALAYTGLADCYTLRSDYGFLEPKEGYALAKGAVTLALKYDDSLAEAHTSLASIKAVTEWDWQGAENEYRRAIELNPKYPTPTIGMQHSCCYKADSIRRFRKSKKRNNWIRSRWASTKIRCHPPV